MADYTTEVRMRVYNDTTAEYIEVGPDGDGLDMVEIRSCDSEGRVESNGNARVCMPIEQAQKVSDALVKYLKDLNN